MVFKNTLIYSIGNAVTALSAFILLPVYTKYLTVEQFGVVSSMQTLSAILVILVSLALERSVFRIYYDYKTPAEQREFLGTVFIGLIIIGIIGISTLFLLKNYLVSLFPTIPFSPYYSYTILFTFLLSIINFSQVMFQVKQNAKRFIITSLSLFFLTAAVNLYLIIYKHLGDKGIIIGTLLAGFVIFLYALYNIFRSITFSFNKNKFRGAIIFSLPMLPTLLSSWVMNVSDRVFIAHFYTQTDVGIYSLAYRISSLVLLAASALFMAYNPIFYQIANDDNLAEAEKEKTIYRYNKMISMAIGLLGILVLMSSDIAIKLFFKKSFSSAYTYIPVFVIAFVIGQMSGLLNLMLYQTKRTWQVTYAVLISAILNIALNYFFIPRFGVYFAVVSTFACNTISFLIQFYFTKKGYYIKFDWKLLIKVFAFSLFAIAENYFLRDQILVISILVKTVTLGLLLLLFKDFIFQLIMLVKRKEI